MLLIKENDKAIIWQQLPNDEIEWDPFTDYEIWMKLDNRKGGYLTPKDEDFGVWAWIAVSQRKAEIIFDEITTGKRKIRPMIEEG